MPPQHQSHIAALPPRPQSHTHIHIHTQDYLLLRSAAAQGHSNLWWALSQLEQMREAAALAAGCAAEDPEGAATAIAPALAGPAGGAQDLLSVSADVIKRTAVLDPAAWKPQV